VRFDSRKTQSVAGRWEAGRSAPRVRLIAADAALPTPKELTMIDRIFSAVLTFSLLIGGTLAIGAALFGVDQRSAAAHAASAPVRVVQLERVVVTAKRLAPPVKVAYGESAETTAWRIR
jgi:hypothetical protein